MGSTTGIETNNYDASGVSQANMTKAATGGSDFYSTMGSLASYTGGTAATSLAATGDNNGAAIVAAATSATAGYGYGSSSTLPTGAYSGSLSTYGGSGEVGSAAYGSAGSTNDMMAMAQEQLAMSQASSISMLMLQDEQSMQTRTYTTVSNLMSARDSLLANMMRNVRGA